MKRWIKDIKNKDRILDVGCGEGRLLNNLGTGVDYTGIDFSKKMIEIAKKRYGSKNHKFIIGDITKKNVWRGLKKFDKVFVIAVVHHLPSKKEQLYVLKEIRDHLKPGGKVYVSFWNLWQKKFWGEHLKNLNLKFKDLPSSLRWVEIPFAKTKLKRFYFAGGKRYWEKLLIEAGWKKAKINFDKNKKNMWVVLG